MIAIAEPHSLHAAVSIGLDSETIISRLSMLCKTRVPTSIENFIRNCTAVYGKVKMVIVDDRFFLETPSKAIYERLRGDDVIKSAMTGREGQGILNDTDMPSLPEGMNVLGKGEPSMGALNDDKGAKKDEARKDEVAALEDLIEIGEDDSGADVRGNDVPRSQMWQIEIRRSMHLDVKKQCLEINLPVLEEYDFANDRVTPDLKIEARPGTFIRSYQEKSLSKMFSHGRARSGFIVLPCGAGKTLVGISAVANIKKCAAVICNTSMAVTQWKQQFTSTWTNVKESDVTCFLSKGGDWQNKPLGKLLITTYPMITLDKKRSKAGEALIEEIKKRQWGIIVLDEVHLSFAEKFWQVLNVVNAHCKLGLTATLVREDDKIKELKNLIGPKLYEADWQDLSNQGYLARVQCVEVWCPMTPLFMRTYLESTARQRKDLWIMNPNKLAAVEFLIHFWEEAGHKIIVFSDDLRPIVAYSDRMNRRCMTGDDDAATREEVLSKFRDASSEVKTLFMSSVGDAAIDLPDASVIIQISSNFGSRQKEAQRLGRILRPKPGSNARYNAHFYTLVSKDTQEMYYSTKRQRYLVDQGYAFKVVTQLEDHRGLDIFTMNKGAGKYGGTELEKDLLQLAIEDRKEAKERVQAALQSAGAYGTGSVKRVSGSMSGLSGGKSLVYGEYERQRPAGPRHKDFEKFYSKKKPKN
ncbi:ERCC3/XPB/SSL2/Rad25 nucleotide excision repair [Guillardia theta CCMP2712]|uniref:DNA 3'-5' helicase n=1 Tax=Guillardia theta (strain CCMP2712) TaxID=905079 RepID=L1J7A0_GUITC|nr:ERCC3/XPB/SSL2/Rad25 nucleotide excision repair [Guillardia theta CCMP2712]EKX43955.1 ERCC3/XPB/SSL2/Rad25 nucleotide excision repair [Guillardia theta CCMP2712]|eukprot:XP_005830935.1 ERCC3/XPB/SSL2/Rad25 nucleotide excision repair [Guillardia theta CCMP2712]